MLSGGQGRAGVDLGPDALVEGGLIEQLQELGWAVKFEGHSQFSDIPYNPVPVSKGDNKVELVAALPDPPIGNMKKPRLVSSVCERVSQHVGGYARQGQLPVTLGGDHSLAMGTVSGTMSKYPDAALIWVSVHPPSRHAWPSVPQGLFNSTS